MSSEQRQAERGDRIVSIDKQPEYDGRVGTIIDIADKWNRGKSEPRIHVQWEGRRNKTWLAVSAQGKRWRLA